MLKEEDDKLLNKIEVITRKLTQLRREVGALMRDEGSAEAALTTLNPGLVLLLQHGCQHDTTQPDTDRSRNSEN